MAPRKASSEQIFEMALLTFLAEQHPFLLPMARIIVNEAISKTKKLTTESDYLKLATKITSAIKREVQSTTKGLGETTPFVPAKERMKQAVDKLLVDLQGFCQRYALIQSFSSEEKIWMLRGILLTRAVDNQMKKMFLTGEVEYQGKGVQGKGFRSLGQEAIYAAALRLKRDACLYSGGRWNGDVVAPLIRDLGVALAFIDDDVFVALNAQAGKQGLPLNGKDLHLGHAHRGVLPAAAPLAISTVTATGQALAMKLLNEKRVALAFIGEGGSSLGEWHEAINLGAVRKLPIIYCIQNNQTALSTPTDAQSATRTFAEKAIGYGMPHVTIDGTDPEAIAAAYTWAAGRARDGLGPTLIELVAMRMCGHAHHDDMLYLGEDPDLSFELPPASDKGYSDTEAYVAWSKRDPIATYSKKLISEGLITSQEFLGMQADVMRQVEEAMESVKKAPWPEPETAGQGVYVQDDPQHRPNVPGKAEYCNPDASEEAALVDEPAIGGGKQTYLDGVWSGIGDVLESNAKSFVFGEDVAPPYGNAFMLLRPLIEKYGDRIINSPLAENAIVGACVGAGLEGMCPIGEIQFNDFVASGFNQVVNNAAKLHYRTGQAANMVLRMPWGGLRKAGPYHSQDTAPWFYRTPGLKIVAPSTPHDARALMKSAAQDGGPVLYYEHIALYRNPKIKQNIADGVNEVPLGKAAFRRLGEDVSIITYGAFVHRALTAAQDLENKGIHAEVLDLRSLMPLDWEAISTTVKRTNRLILIGEDSRTGSILESIASRVGDELFEYLDAPIRVVGALDTPVPYAPSLEPFFLPTASAIEAAIEEVARY